MVQLGLGLDLSHGLLIQSQWLGFHNSLWESGQIQAIGIISAHQSCPFFERTLSEPVVTMGPNVGQLCRFR